MKKVYEMTRLGGISPNLAIFIYYSIGYVV
jgi:hypothetical protein